jgi:hypothetical protein
MNNEIDLAFQTLHPEGFKRLSVKHKERNIPGAVDISVVVIA